ncbi:SIR2 family protein [Clostridium perfringens]|uniref:SIR2 family protein n=1 Tax=Clostridium perfringens TaxID=1502 RepID=UPI0018E4B4C8|nr:SIR2 family protein [Clostridium perfringens]MBI6038174.1 hypothetical protein [Clostridium perfringens]
MNKESYLREMEDIVDAINNAKENNIKINFLIGAGCSVSAGVPLAKELIDEISQKYPKEFERIENKNSYGDCMTSITALERRNLILKYVENAKVNWANLMLAELLKEGIIDCVLTTNFDNILMKSSFMVGNFPAIYDLAASENFRSELVFKNSIVHLHGQHTGFLLCNSKKELDKQYQSVKKLFLELNKNSMWIILGYSGESDPIVKLFKENKNSDNRLFWIGYEDNNLPKNLEELFNDKEKYCFFVKGYNADKFMIDLSKSLGNYPPKIIEKPFTYLNSLIDSITEFKEETFLISKNPIIETTKKIVNEAVSCFEEDFEKKFEYYFELNMFDKMDKMEKNASDDEKKIIQKIKDEKVNIDDLIKNINENIDALENKTLKDTESIRLIISLLRFFENDKSVELLRRIHEILNEEQDDYELIMCDIFTLEVLYFKELSKEESDNNILIKKIDIILNRLLYMKERFIGKQNEILKEIIIRLISKSDLYMKKIGNEDKATEVLDYALDIINSNKPIFKECDYYKIIIYIKKLIISQDKNIDLLAEVITFTKLTLENYNYDEENSQNVKRLLKTLIRYQLDLIKNKNVDFIINMINKSIIDNKFIYENPKLLIMLLGIIYELLNYENVNEIEILLSGIINNIKKYKCNKTDDEKFDLASLCNGIAFDLNKLDKSLLANEVIDQSIEFSKSFYNTCTKGLILLYLEDDFTGFEANYSEAEKYTDKINEKSAILQTKYKELALYQIDKNFDNDNILENIEKGLELGVIQGWEDLYRDLESMEKAMEEKITAEDEAASTYD